ncbi:TIGR00366 family protein, partial [Amycolatopsis sp. NPDC059021]|uniref:TIGR00366 family protein n=1 Tax=Amycolatopsis sp. NPDC059021 TaxID=3346704 RepID=UPI00366C880A
MSQPTPAAPPKAGFLARTAIRAANWSERWFPNTLVFALLVVAVVAVAAVAIGASPMSVASAFGGGFWDLIPFTMQMAMVAIGGYVVATAGAGGRGGGQLNKTTRHRVSGWVGEGGGGGG